MNPSLTTRPSLLLRLRDPRDARAWEWFVDAYTPLVFGFCRKRGLQASDAADVSQEVMAAVARAVPRFDYDPGRGGFRDWLFTVTRNKLNDFYNRRGRQPQGTGETGVHDRLEDQADLSQQHEAWERHWRQHVFERAAAEVRGEFTPVTWRAFWATAVEDLPVKAVAVELKITAGAVYIARSRVTARLRQAVEEIDEQDAG
jgi:RNA polymerase sigma factor (sigma-70 family)